MEMLPMGAIVTSSGIGAEMNCGAVITNETKHIKAGMVGATLAFAILEPDYTISDPYTQVISGENRVSDDLALAIIRNTVINN